MNIIVHENVTLSDVIKMIEEHRIVFFVSSNLVQDIFGRWVISSEAQLIDAKTLSVAGLLENVESLSSVLIELVVSKKEEKE